MAKCKAKRKRDTKKGRSKVVNRSATEKQNKVNQARNSTKDYIRYINSLQYASANSANFDKNTELQYAALDDAKDVKALGI